MKKILFAAFALLYILPGANAQKERITFDTTTKKLTILTEIEIDTASLYAKKAKAQARKQRLVDALAAVNIELDTVNAQIKTARKLMTGRRGGGGNNRAAEAPTPQPIEKPKATKPKTTKTKKQ